MEPTFKYPPQAILIDANLIQIEDRTRIDYGDIEGLANSIKENGLIHPPVVDTNNKLIAGGRRTRAITTVLHCSKVPVLVLETLDDTHLAILEAEENIQRKAPTWQERVLGVAKVHETAKRGAILNARKWTIVETGSMLNISFANVNNALTLARLIRAGDKEINSQPTITDAFKILLTRKEREAQKVQAEMLLQRSGNLQTTSAKDAIASLEASGEADFFTPAPATTLGVGVLAPNADEDEMPGTSPAQVVASTPSVQIPLSKICLKGDMRDVLRAMPAASVDHIITDPPYGIDMSMLAQDNTGIKDISDVSAEHDVEDNLALFPPMFAESFRVLRDNGFFILWYDMTHHEKLHEMAIAAGFKTQRWPLIWKKTHACINQFAGKNFTKNYEVAMLCRKGNAVLLQPQATSIWEGSVDETKLALGHPFVKPAALWKWLYSAVCMRGQTVLDPFAGVGSATVAAIDYGLLPIAVECNSAHYDRLVINTANAFKKLNSNTQFV